MGKRASISEHKHIATVSGWEDGKHYERPVTKLDRWELQSADKLVIHMDGHDIVLVQDPHSNHLGGYIWLSSIVFCSYLVSLHNGMHKGRGHRHEWIHMDHSKRWVELGSGVGLIGLMLHRLGVENVIVTDIEELLPIIEKNVEANDVLVQSISGRRSNEKSMELCASMPTAVVVEPLLWNDDDAIHHVKSAGPIDYIVACDCIYSEASAVDLVLTMDKLAGPDTTIICLSEVRNQAAQDTFMEQAKSLFTYTVVLFFFYFCSVIYIMATNKWVPFSKIAHGTAITSFTPTHTFANVTAPSPRSRPVTIYSSTYFASSTESSLTNVKRPSTASSDVSTSTANDYAFMLPLEVGDDLYIFEQNDAWYRGYVLGSLEEGRKPNSAPNGIFPKSHVQIKEYVDLDLTLQDRLGRHSFTATSPSAQSATNVPGNIGDSNSFDYSTNLSSASVELQSHHQRRIQSRPAISTAMDSEHELQKLQRPSPPPLPMVRFDQSTITGADEPLVDEIAACASEWNCLLYTYLEEKQYGAFNAVRDHINYLFQARRQLLDQALSSEELARLRREIIQRIVTMNISQHREMIIRHPEHGFILDINNTSVATLYYMHWKYTISDQIPMTTLFRQSSLLDSDAPSSSTQTNYHQGMPPGFATSSSLATPWRQDRRKRPTYRYKGGDFHHLFLDLKAFVAHICQPGEWTELRFSLYSDNQEKFVTEPFVVHLNYNGMPKNEGQIGKIQTLFIDLASQDLNEHLYLVCYIFRLGGMKFVDKEKDHRGLLGHHASTIFGGHHHFNHSHHRPAAHTNLFRRPFGCAVLNIGRFLYQVDPENTATKASGGVYIGHYFILPSDHDMRIYSPSSESDFAHLHEDIIRDNTKELIQSSRAESVCVNLRMFYGQQDEVLMTNAALLQDIPLTARIGFPDVVFPDNERNELYITLDSGDFAHFGRTRNIQVIICVRDNFTGDVVEMAVAVGSGTPMTSTWESAIYHHEMKPTWNEMVKVKINDVKVWQRSHVFLVVKHRSRHGGGVSPIPNGVGNTSTSDKILAIGYMPLFIPPLSHDFVADGTHTLCLYKYDRQLLHPSSYFGVVPWCTETTTPANMEGQENMLAAVRQTHRRNSTLRQFSNSSYASARLGDTGASSKSHNGKNSQGSELGGGNSGYHNGVANARLHPIRDSLVVSTFLCSTQFTQNTALVKLINWRSIVRHDDDALVASDGESADELLVILDKFTFVGEREVVKFLADVFDALLDILVFRVPDYPDKQDAIHDQVIVAITWILSIVQDRRFVNFRPVLNVYINQRFYCSDEGTYQLYTSYRYRLKHNKKLRQKMTLSETTYNQLLQGLIRLSTNPSDITKAKRLRSSIKGWEYLFLFIRQSREMHRAYEDRAQHELREQMYKRDLQRFFDLATDMMRPDQPSSMIGTQTLVLQHFCEVITEVRSTYSAKEIVDIVSTLVDACSHVTGKLVGFKLGMILSIIKAPIFSDKACCFEFGKRVIGWIKVWLNSYMAVAKEVIFARTMDDSGQNQEDIQQQTRLPRAQWLENLRLSLTITHEILEKIRKVRGMSLSGLSPAAMTSSPVSSASATAIPRTRPTSMSTLGDDDLESIVSDVYDEPSLEYSTSGSSLDELTKILLLLVPQLLQAYKDLQRLTTQALQATGSSSGSTTKNNDNYMSSSVNTARHSLTALRERAGSIRDLPQVPESSAGFNVAATDQNKTTATPSFPVVLQALATSPTTPFPSIYPFQANATNDAAIMAGSDLATVVTSGLLDLTVVLLDLFHLTPRNQWLYVLQLMAANKDDTPENGGGGPNVTADYICTLCYVCMAILFGDDVYKLAETHGTVEGYDAFMEDPARERRKWPKNWLNLDVVAYKIILGNVLSPVADILEMDDFLPRQEQQNQNNAGRKGFSSTALGGHGNPNHECDIMVRLWRVVFMTVVRVLASPSLEVETFLPQEQRAVWKLAGNIRGGEGTEMLERLWDLTGPRQRPSTLAQEDVRQRQESKDLKMKPQLLDYFDHHNKPEYEVNAADNTDDDIDEDMDGGSTPGPSGDGENADTSTSDKETALPTDEDVSQIHLESMPVLLRPLCSASLTLHDKLRSTTVGIIADLITTHIPKANDAVTGQNLMIGTIDKLVMNNGKGSDEIRVKWVAELQQAFQLRLTTDSERVWGQKVVDSLANLMELLLQIRSLPIDSVEFMDERINATLKLMKFIQVCERQEIYVKYVHQLVDLHLHNSNFVEAALTLRFHSDLLKWDPYDEVDAIPELGYIVESSFSRKKGLYETMIAYLDKGTAWELCIDLCQEIGGEYALTVVNYPLCSGVLRQTAEFMEKIVTKERYYSEYFRVGFYGRGFPFSIRNQQFIYRGMAWEKMASFVERMQNRHPNAQLVSGKLTTGALLPEDQIRDLETELDGQYMQITAVTPVMNPLTTPVLTNPLTSDKIKKYYQFNKVSQFTYSRPVTREEENDDSDTTTTKLDFLNLWTEKTIFTSEDTFPTITLRSKIVSMEVKEISPIENAVEAMNNKTHELITLEKNYSAYLTNPRIPYNLNPFSMALNGAVDAPVNGGVPLYKKTFLSPYFSKKNPDMLQWVDQLKAAIDEQVVVIDRCLITHGQLVSSEMRPFHNNLIELYKKNFTDDIVQLRRRGTTLKATSVTTTEKGKGISSSNKSTIRKSSVPQSSRRNLNASSSHPNLSTSAQIDRPGSTFFKDMDKPLTMKSRTNSASSQQRQSLSSPGGAGNLSSFMAPKSTNYFSIPNFREQQPKFFTGDKMQNSSSALSASSAEMTNTNNIDHNQEHHRHGNSNASALSAPSSLGHLSDELYLNKKDRNGKTGILSKSLKNSIRRVRKRRPLSSGIHK
ncbi:hypothetical protein BCR42DRAFT_348262 [Absidia repens]|uniref:C2 domain-containing protein n=1 Tax=Absidia repens TaxID=90262 RepID=A0A1X2INM5_9FUNG|nr:hypothetical protein BCR42DRAFT_348262 [Absidia repens]